MTYIGTAFTASILATGAFDLPTQIDYPECSHTQSDYPECSLTQKERDRIWDEIHFAIRRMNHCMAQADKEADLISDIDIEYATKAAISGAIAGISTRNVYGVFITSCLNTIGCIAGDAYWHFRESRRFVEQAEHYAYQADGLQERLWRDQ